MSENTAVTIDETTIENVTVTLEDVVTEFVGDRPEYTAYSVAVIINNVFKATETEKQIPTQMMYQYTRNGMIAKGKKGKATDIRYTKEEVQAFVLKYTSKHVGQ